MGSTGAATAAGRRRGGSRRPPAKRRPKPRSTRAAPRRRARSTSRSLAASLSWRGRLLVAASIALALAAGYFLWLRDSSLVAIDDVDVAGVKSGDTQRIVSELTHVAEGMTTLHLDGERLERVAEAFPTVASIELDRSFPHGLRIEVTERPPRAVVANGDEEVAVAADGTVLAGVAPPEGLPVLELDEVPTTGRLGGEPLEQALIAGAAPEELAPLVEEVGHSDDFGVEIVLRGIPVRFGTGARAAEKWDAAAAVLADPKLKSLTYLDVRVPERPATGGG